MPMVLFQEILALVEHGIFKSIQLPYLNVNLILPLRHNLGDQKRKLLDSCMNYYTTQITVGILTEEKYLALLHSIGSLLFQNLTSPVLVQELHSSCLFCFSCLISNICLPHCLRSFVCVCMCVYVIYISVIGGMFATSRTELIPTALSKISTKLLKLKSSGKPLQK